MTEVWASCRGQAAPSLISGALVRVVESQEQVATTGLVDNLSEQVLLEELIEATKPARPPGSEGLHYLLATPFRYPPLAHGSRFGSRFEPSLFYGSRGLVTALAETAYYRLVFWTGMERPPPGGRLFTQHTAFGARYRTRLGISLQQPPCSRYSEQISDPAEYSHSRQLGSALREAGFAALEFISARDPQRGVNVALFTPAALFGKRPRLEQAWLCETRADEVCFTSAGSSDVQRFPLETFLVNDRLPVPALE